VALADEMYSLSQALGAACFENLAALCLIPVDNNESQTRTN